MKFETDLKRAVGKGSAKTGTGHFIEQRISAIALVILIPLFLFAVGPLIGEPVEVVREGMSGFWRPMIAILTVLTVALHLIQGLQVVIEDYVHGGISVALLVAMKLGTWALALGAVFSIAKIAFQA